MNDNGEIPAEERGDPFAQGLAAHRDRSARDACPFPAEHVEARRWNAGWDHAAFKAEGVTAVVGRIGAPGLLPARGKPWSHGELVVLETLAGSGERLGSLASRLGRSRSSVQEECDRREIVLTQDQLDR